MIITPAIAAKMLAKNTNNRRLRPATVTRIAQDIRSGNWHEGVGSIVLDTDDNVMDGQHRLAGCVEADMPITAVVVAGVSPAAKVAIDTGMKRTLADVLAWRGETGTAALGAALTLGWRWRNGRLIDLMAPSHSESLAWLDANPSIRDAVRHSHGLRHLRCPGSAGAAFYHQTSLVDPEEAATFYERFKDGEELTQGDPVLALRTWHLNQIIRQSSGRAPSQAVYLALMVKAWNAWITGKPLNVVVWRRGGRNREDFPALLDADGQEHAVTDEIRG